MVITKQSRIGHKAYSSLLASVAESRTQDIWSHPERVWTEQSITVPHWATNHTLCSAALQPRFLGNEGTDLLILEKAIRFYLGYLLLLRSLWIIGHKIVLSVVYSIILKSIRFLLFLLWKYTRNKIQNMFSLQFHRSFPPNVPCFVYDILKSKMREKNFFLFNFLTEIVITVSLSSIFSDSEMSDGVLFVSEDPDKSQPQPAKCPNKTNVRVHAFLGQIVWRNLMTPLFYLWITPYPFVAKRFFSPYVRCVYTTYMIHLLVELLKECSDQDVTYPIIDVPFT